MKKGFTLLEILIVMTIIALLIALGAGGMIQWRENTEASQATQEVLAILKEIQTKAKNNTIPTDHIQDPTQFAQVNSRNYGFVIQQEDSGDNQKLYYQICWKNTAETWANKLCQTDKQYLIPQRYSNIAFSVYSGINPGMDCDFNDLVIIENLTGMIIDQNNSYKDCNIALKIISQNTEYSYINFNKNNIKRVYP